MNEATFAKFQELVFEAGLGNEVSALFEEIRNLFGVGSETRCVAYQNCKYFATEFAFTPLYFADRKEYPKFTRNHRIPITRKTTRNVLVADDKKWGSFERELDSFLAAISRGNDADSSTTSIVPISWLALLVEVGLMGCGRFELNKLGSLEHPLQFFLMFQELDDSPSTWSDFMHDHRIDGDLENFESIDSGWRTQVFDPVIGTRCVLDALLRLPLKTSNPCWVPLPAVVQFLGTTKPTMIRFARKRLSIPSQARQNGNQNAWELEFWSTKAAIELYPLNGIRLTTPDDPELTKYMGKARSKPVRERFSKPNTS